MVNLKLKDHREIGRELDLFSFYEVSPGAIFWHSKGYIIYKVLVEHLRKTLLSEGYEEISTPVLVKSKLFKKSGHFEFYKENMFNFIYEKEMYSLKPMNCPEASLIFSSKKRSYKELPIRYAEFGILHRNELSGVLGGAFRVRQFVIDDAHHFITPEQIQDEIHKLLLWSEDLYKKFDFHPEFYLATRPDKAMGDKRLWELAEKDLKQALKNSKVKYQIKEKDGAFYGPKIDIHIKDSQNRDWQLATIQLDFQIPEKMNLKYIDDKGKEMQPVIIHRAIYGSIERFIGIITEHYQGNFPLWISPVQVKVIPVSEKHFEFAKKVNNLLKENSIRSELDEDNSTVSLKIRNATLQKIPYMFIIGDKEIEKSKKNIKLLEDAFISVRTRDGKDLDFNNLYEFIQSLKKQLENFL
jgi:threonyl-tRNA synthetase